MVCPESPLLTHLAGCRPPVGYVPRYGPPSLREEHAVEKGRQVGSSMVPTICRSPDRCPESAARPPTPRHQCLQPSPSPTRISRVWRCKIGRINARLRQNSSRVQKQSSAADPQRNEHTQSNAAPLENGTRPDATEWAEMVLTVQVSCVTRCGWDGRERVSRKIHVAKVFWGSAPSEAQRYQLELVRRLRTFVQ